MAAISVAAVGIAVVPHRSATSTSSETLDRLLIIERSAEDPTSYRSAFGKSWADLDCDGSNTRDEVLLSTVDRTQPLRVQRQGRCQADMVAGTWTDLYTGAVMTWTNLKDTEQAQAIPIDHT